MSQKILFFLFLLLLCIFVNPCPLKIKSTIHNFIKTNIDEKYDQNCKKFCAYYNYNTYDYGYLFSSESALLMCFCAEPNDFIGNQLIDYTYLCNNYDKEYDQFNCLDNGKWDGGYENGHWSISKKLMNGTIVKKYIS